MRKYLFLNVLILIGIIFFSACKKDKIADAELGITAQYGNENSYLTKCMKMHKEIC